MPSNVHKSYGAPDTPSGTQRLCPRGNRSRRAASGISCARCHNPVINSGEMGLTAAQMIERISSDQSLVKQFSAVYGSAPNSTLVSRALAMYIRGIFADSSPFDFGNMTALQRKGFNLFSGRANCIACHSGPNFTDERTHAIGLSPSSDEGGYRVKLKEEDRYSFKTPSLRGIAKTGPYMHDGRFETLEQVVEHYNRGGDNGTESYRSPLIRPLDLTDADKAALVEFLNALSGRIYDNAP